MLVWPTGRLAACLDHLDRSLLWEKNATPCKLFFYHSLYLKKKSVSTLIGGLIGLNHMDTLLSQGKQTLSYDKAIVYYSGHYSPQLEFDWLRG